MLKDNVTIIHWPGLMLRNVDPLSRNPVDGYLVKIESGSIEFFKNRNYPSFHITLIHLSDEWQDKLWAGYIKSRHFKRILLSFQKLHEPKNEGEPAAVPVIETSKPTNDKPPAKYHQHSALNHLSLH